MAEAESSNDLEQTLKKYIEDSRSVNINAFRELLKGAEPSARYNLLMRVRGVLSNTWTGLHEGTRTCDLESIRQMVEGFTPNQKYDIVKEQKGDGKPALHLSAENGYSRIIKLLLDDLSSSQKLGVLKVKASDGDTALHRAYFSNKAESVQAILASIPFQQQNQLLEIENSRGIKVPNISTELRRQASLLETRIQEAPNMQGSIV